MSNRWFEQDEYYYGGSQRHPGCPGGCGNLADECTCRRPNPLGSMKIVKPVKVVDVYNDEPEYDPLIDSAPSFCSGTWKGKPCTDPANGSGYCDIHEEKYS
jgi:hypothetical protein